MTTSISTPTSLATFSTPHASSSKAPHVALNPVHGISGSGGRLAVVAVQGDGVWTYNDLRATTSYTVPPSTTFITSPVSFYPSPRTKPQNGVDTDATGGIEGSESSKRMTAVGVSVKGGKKSSLWVWRGEERAEKEEIIVDRPISSLHYIASPRYPLLILHDVPSRATLIAPDLSFHKVTIPTVAAEVSIPIASQVLSSSFNKLQYASIDAEGNYLLTTIDNLRSTEEISAEVVSSGRLAEGKRRFVAADISPEGVISAIDDRDTLVSRNIKADSTFSLTPYPTLLHPSSTPAILSIPTCSKPLVLIPSSHPSPSLLLALPSPELPALLAYTAISSFSSSSGSITHLSLLDQNATATGTHLVGAVFTYKSGENGEGGRSVVYTCEVTIPEKGVGMNALLGSQARTSEFIGTVASAGNAKKDAFSATHTHVLESIKASLEKGDILAAETHWSTWIAEMEGKSRGKGLIPDAFIKKLLNILVSFALPDFDKKTEDAGSGAVKKVKTGPYAGSIVKSILERRLAGDEMIKGGLVATVLLPLQDWENVLIAIPSLPTLPSSSLVLAIKSILHPTSPITDPSISLDALLRVILALPAPGPTYRLDLRNGLSVEDATAVLGVLVTWGEKWVELNSAGLQWDVDSDSLDIVPALKAQDSGDLPTLESLISHSSYLLDAHTPNFLSHPPSHDLLIRLQATLEPLLLMQADYRALRAPLDAILTLARREEAKRHEQERKQALMNGKSGRGSGAVWEERRGGLKDGLGGAKVGKWKVEDFAF